VCKVDYGGEGVLCRPGVRQGAYGSISQALLVIFASCSPPVDARRALKSCVEPVIKCGAQDPIVSVLYAMLVVLPVRLQQCASATEIQRRVW
jgi:hypothetical protein